MTWIKQPTYSWVGDQQFAAWYFETWLVSKGWTFGWKKVTTTTYADTYWAISKSWNTASGASQTMNLVYELEFGGAADLNISAWDGIEDYATWSQRGAATNIYGDSNMTVLSEGSDVTLWTDDSSPAWIAMMDGRLIGMELDPAGWLVDSKNDNTVLPGTRPYYGIRPLFEKGGAGMYQPGNNLLAHQAQNIIIDRLISDTSLYQDYVALGSSYGNTLHWEDPSQQLKMKAYERISAWSTYEVAQIGSEYYITCGPLLLPVGSTEPTL